ncbi:enoyl-CoA hydratase-related protein [Ruixingdingia sedimenti]|uniref:enoyl-CoA hydratase n=1 Tax=Ruixingdingia sedimenti TaxID=3073604 RepID=A0ABU1F5I1_9RHOB|nr:enoyl-CoA hydratase-related protein [Xinfangfangia sp. LG-4]MDR5652094.1 enoyl-CoA hydratase-related protein [Xinfangfangia sp. LG-4]
MGGTVGLERDGDVAVVVIDNPPVNALGHAVRAGLDDAFAAIAAEPAFRAVVIRAAGRGFPAGADIGEFGKPLRPPPHNAVFARIEGCALPVVAAIHGTAFGGGLELALAAHYRIALADARLGLPEVTLGILPGGGGTVRTPRLVGAEAALRLMLTGRPVTAPEALAMGLIDGVVEDDLPGAAVALARLLADEGKGPRPTRDRADGLRDPAAYGAAVAAARREGPAGAAARIVDCVEAALLLPFDQALAYAEAAADELIATPEAAALRHLFFAERRAARLPGLSAAPRPLVHLGIVGAGAAGAGLAHAALCAGLSVTLLDSDPDLLTQGLERIARLQEGAVAAGRLTVAGRDADWDRLTGATRPEALAGADMVVETTADEPAAKAAAMAALGAVLRPGAVIGTTSTRLDLSALAEAAGRPADLLGLWPSPPAEAGGVLELVPTATTAADVLATAQALARHLGRVAICTGAGGALRPLRAAFDRACELLLLQGAAPAAVDAAFAPLGLTPGPFARADSLGADPAAPLAAALRAAGRGWHPPEPGEDPALDALLAAERAARGIAPRALTPAEMRLQPLAALANAGARLVAAGAVLRPSDLDVAWIAGGQGFPRVFGGPMHWADTLGPVRLRNVLRGFAALDPGLFEPAPVLDDLIRQGRHFADLDD